MTNEERARVAYYRGMPVRVLAPNGQVVVGKIAGGNWCTACVILKTADEPYVFRATWSAIYRAVKGEILYA